MQLSLLSNNKNNNFNLIRLLAATLVIYSHHFALYYGSGVHLDPLAMISNNKISFGSLAVNIFFVVSGFLISASLVNNSLKRFIWARVLRIYPAFFFMTIITIIIFYVLFSQESITDFFTKNDVLLYMKNIFILGGLNVEISGIFDINKYPSTINGSLWTLPWELRMYILLTIVGLFSFHRKYIVIFLAFFSAGAYIVNELFSITSNLSIILAFRLTAFFFMGAAFYFFKEKIFLSNKLAYVFIALILFAFLFQQYSLIFILNVIAVPYLVFVLAYMLPTIKFLNGNNDYSYGVYIYAFPMQQLVLYFYITNYTSELFYETLLISTLLTFFFATISWHLFEKNFLKLKKVVS